MKTIRESSMTSSPTKLWKGSKRLAKRLLGRRAFSINNPNNHVRLLRWALTIKEGDYIATCEGCNRKVADIEVGWNNEGFWSRSKPNNTWVVSEVGFTDTRGRIHYCPGGGCAYPAETPEEVTAYFRGWAFDGDPEGRIRHWNGNDHERTNKQIAELRVLQEALRSGRPIVDEHGELLPEFDHPLV